jgi:hypothetical protein
MQSTRFANPVCVAVALRVEVLHTYPPTPPSPAARLYFPRPRLCPSSSRFVLLDPPVARRLSSRCLLSQVGTVSGRPTCEIVIRDCGMVEGFDFELADGPVEEGSGSDD